MLAFVMMANKTKKHPVLIFWDAICYYEIRWHQVKLGKYYMKFCEPGDVKGSHLVMAVPQFVEDYCLDVLAGRVKPLKLIDKKEVGDGREVEIPREVGEAPPTA